MTDIDDTTATLFQKLTDRSYTTYQSRIKASERLARLNACWNIALMVSAVAVTIDSVVLLVDSTALGDKGDVVLVCASIITLFISVTVSGMNLSGRSRDMFTSYRRIQRLSAEAERHAVHDCTSERLNQLSQEYDDMLDNSDNHRLCDYLKIRPEKREHWWQGRSDIAALVPPILLIAVSIGLVSPAVAWMLST